MAAGLPALDTGQGVAKNLLGDPENETEAKFEWRSNGRAARGKSLQHLGLLLKLRSCFCRRAVNHDWKNATRIGEASHPGPNGGGARATARRRQENEQDEVDEEADNGMGGMGGFADMLRPLIEKMIKQILEEILGGGALKQMVAGMLTTSSAGSSAALVEGDIVQAKGAGKNKRVEGDPHVEGKGGHQQRWNKRGKDHDGGGGDNAGQKGSDKKDGNGGGSAPGKGKGKASGKDGGSGDGTKPAGKGDAKAQGKTRSKGKAQQGEDDGDWTQVVRKTAGEWQLRATDWSDPVVSYDDLVAKATGEGDLVRAIAVLNEEQKETVLSLYRGSGKAHALLIVELKQSPDAERCPGAIGGRLVFRQAIFTRAFSPGLQAPQPKVKAPGCKVEVLKSSVVLVRFLQRYLDKDAWTQIVKQPQRALLDHLAKFRLKAMDSWGWAVEPVAGGVGQQVFGKRRLADKDIPTLLASSGRSAFFEPSRSFDMGPVVTEWQQQQDDETPGAYLARCLTLPADFGLVSGRKQLGKRMKHDPSVPVQRMWQVQMVPGMVTVEQLTNVLGQVFTDVEVVHQRRRGNARDCIFRDYIFRGKTTEQADSMALPLTYGDEELVLWVRHAPLRQGHRQAQEIKTSGAWSLLGPKPAFASEPRAGVPEASETGDGETAGDDSLEGGADKSTSKDGAAAKNEKKEEKKDEVSKRGAPATGPAAKRVASSQRALPEGAKVVHIDKDGNCMFASLARGINDLNPDASHKLTAAEVRAKIAVHLRKNEANYIKSWDQEMPDRTKAESWKKYIEAVETDKVWGGLTELRAACRVWDIRCIVFPTSECIEPFHLHGQAKKRVVALYFTGHHYDLLQGDNGSLPKSILGIKGAPEEVPLRGGGEGDAASVWTRSSRGRAGASVASAWTSVAGASAASGGSGHLQRPRPAASVSRPVPSKRSSATSEASASKASAWTRSVGTRVEPKASTSGSKTRDRCAAGSAGATIAATPAGSRGT